jgi:hypothetical protein
MFWSFCPAVIEGNSNVMHVINRLFSPPFQSSFFTSFGLLIFGWLVGLFFFFSRQWNFQHPLLLSRSYSISSAESASDLIKLQPLPIHPLPADDTTRSVRFNIKPDFTALEQPHISYSSSFEDEPSFFEDF